MPKKLLAGPILGLESEVDYTVCFVTPKKTVTPKLVVSTAQSITVKKITDTPHGLFWRATFKISIAADSTFVNYQVLIDGEAAVDRHGRERWEFFVPSKSEKPRIAYASCNGFSSADLHQKTANPYALWEKMSNMHQNRPFALLIMGGNQLYADSIWTQVSSLKNFHFGKKSKKTAPKN